MFVSPISLAKELTPTDVPSPWRHFLRASGSETSASPKPPAGHSVIVRPICARNQTRSIDSRAPTGRPPERCLKWSSGRGPPLWDGRSVHAVDGR